MSSEEEIFNELVQTVKDLSEKNRSLALKVNELEIKVQQIDQHSTDIGTIKTGIDSANTDRTAIKELLNLKVTETKNGLDEKVNNFKNDLAFLKEDLHKVDSNINTVKENVSKLSTDFQNSLKKVSDETLQTFETLKTEVNTKISKNTEDISNVKSLIEQNAKDVTSNLESMGNLFQEKIEALTGQITTLESNLIEKFQSADNELNGKLDQAVSSLTNDLNAEKEVTNTLFEKTATDIATELQSISDNVNAKFTEFNEGVNQKFDNEENLISNLSSQTDMSLNALKSQIDKFFDISDNHSEVLKAFEEVLNQVRANIEQASLEAKQDQELMLGSFQKIIVGQAENLRNELLTFSKEIRTNLSKFNDDTSSKFTSIDETNKINERIKALDADLHTKSENIRKSVVETLDENVAKFNTAIKESISSVDEYRVDLERFKDDIESLIERKVNEKTEFSMELFNNLLAKAEHITKLVLDSKVTKVPQIAVPIPEIKNSQRTEEE